MSQHSEFWWNPERVKQTTLPTGEEIAWAEAGEGSTTLVLLHGLASNFFVWWNNLPVWSGHYRCLALDWPGYGRSGKPLQPITLSYFVEVLIAWLDQQGVERVALAGHSMGGQIAIHAALRYPERFEKLLLFAPAGLEVFTALEKQWFKTFYSPDWIRFKSSNQIRRHIELNFFQMPKEAEFMIEDRQELAARPQDLEAYARLIYQCTLAMLDEPVFDRLGDLRLPVLIIFGKQDALIPNRFLHRRFTTEYIAKQGAARIPNAQLELIPKAGHFVQFEKPIPVNSLAEGFIGLPAPAPQVKRKRWRFWGLWFMVYGLWFMVYGLWFMVMIGSFLYVWQKSNIYGREVPI